MKLTETRKKYLMDGTFVITEKKLKKLLRDSGITDTETEIENMLLDGSLKEYTEAEK